jgi:hypothetical protein
MYIVGFQSRKIFAILLACGLVLATGAANWEEKKKYHYLPDGSDRKKKHSLFKRIMRTLAPSSTSQDIEPSIPNELVAARGTRLTIPENAFVNSRGKIVSGQVRLTITEVIDPLDFVAAGVDLMFYPDNNRREFFESAGMFRVEAAEVAGERVALASGKKIEVQFPGVVKGDDFWVYRHDAQKKWKLHGHNQFRDGENYLQFGTRKYSIDALNVWWNFDKPKPEAACSKGRVEAADGKPLGPYSIYSIGISYKGSFARYSIKSSEFKVNVHKAAQARFMVIATNGQIGISEVKQIHDKTGFDQTEEGPNNVCQDVGLIKIAKIDETIIADKKRLSEFLGLPVTEYTVKYQNTPPFSP